MPRFAQRHGLPLVEDLGSGTLVDLEPLGPAARADRRARRFTRADLVTFSGDKLLGGPQAGLVVGRADLIAALAKNPLKRALRLDKIRLAALEAVLRLYADPDRLAVACRRCGSWRGRRAEIVALAGRVLPALAQALDGIAGVALIETKSQIGSGALPVSLLPSAGVVAAVSVGAAGRGRGAGHCACVAAGAGDRPNRGGPRRPRPAQPRRRSGLRRPTARS